MFGRRFAAVLAASLVACVTVFAQDDASSDHASQKPTSDDGSDATVVPQSATAAEEQTTDSYALLFERIQNRIRSLESNVSGLLGRIEDLEFQVQEARHNQQRRINNIEQRVEQALSGSSVTGVPTTPGNATPIDIVAVTTPGSDDSFYAQGMNSLRNEDYASALGFFEELLRQFPNSKHAPDSLYWIGEVLSSFEPTNLERARQHFVQLVRLYPDHEQIPKALFKLGTVYHQIGDKTRALEYLNQVLTDYPDHEVVELATTYIAQLD